MFAGEVLGALARAALHHALQHGDDLVGGRTGRAPPTVAGDRECAVVRGQAGGPAQQDELHRHRVEVPKGQIEVAAGCVTNTRGSLASHPNTGAVSHTSRDFHFDGTGYFS